MSRTRFISSDGLAGFLDFLSGRYKVLAPVEKPATAKPSVVFTPWLKGMKCNLAKATVSPKETVLPECEVLLTFSKQRSPEDLNQFDMGLNAEPKGEPTVVFGCRPCDARGFTALDMPFLSGLFADPYYKAKRDMLTVVSLTCDSGCETCFCHWVGGGPTSPIGSDILMTAIEGGYVLQAVTSRGDDLFAACDLPDGQDKFPEAEEVRKKAWATLVPAPALAEAPQKLSKIFSNEEFWTRMTNKCLSCGACTYFCPTCYCFNITDEGSMQDRNGGRRLRSWDNCMSARYTREASGHNPRPLKFERMRNRVSHKFWTFFENWGSFLCSGCGRCISNCPVHLDIREIVLAAIAEADNAGAQNAGK